MFALHVHLQKSVLYYKYNMIWYDKCKTLKIHIDTKYIRTHIQNLMYELQLSKIVVGYTNSNLFYEMQWVCIMYSIS